MSRKMWLLFAILAATIPDLGLCDCGCNKQNRNNPPSSSSVSESLDRVSRSLDPVDYSEDMPADDEDSTFKRLVRESRDKMSAIPGNPRSPIGTDKPVFAEDRESPVREVNVERFFLDRYEVSNRDFDTFVEATGYRTDAEVFGDSFVFRDEISEAVQKEYVDYRVASANWWYKVKNVTWQQPEGPGSSIAGKHIFI